MKRNDPDKLLTLLEWRRDIRNLMGRFSADHTIRQEAYGYERYWSHRADVSLGTNEGFYAGAEAVAGYYKALDEEIRLTAHLAKDDFPEKLGSLTNEELYGVGAMTYLPLDSHVIEIAGDGETAKGLWNIRGSYSKMTVAGPVSYWLFGWAAVDLIRENDEWRIWHMQLLRNLDCQCGTAFGIEPAPLTPVDAYAAMADFHMPEPNIPTPLMESYYTDRPFAHSPRCPEPYESFADTFSYGI